MKNKSNHHYNRGPEIYSIKYGKVELNVPVVIWFFSVVLDELPSRQNNNQKNKKPVIVSIIEETVDDGQKKLTQNLNDISSRILSKIFNIA